MQHDSIRQIAYIPSANNIMLPRNLRET